MAGADPTGRAAREVDGRQYLPQARAHVAVGNNGLTAEERAPACETSQLSVNRGIKKQLQALFSRAERAEPSAEIQQS